MNCPWSKTVTTNERNSWSPNAYINSIHGPIRTAFFWRAFIRILQINSIRWCARNSNNPKARFQACCWIHHTLFQMTYTRIRAKSVHILFSRFSPAPRCILLLVQVRSDTHLKRPLFRELQGVHRFLFFGECSLPLYSKNIWNNIIAMGWKFYVPDDQLEHGFHQISEFPRGNVLPL